MSDVQSSGGFSPTATAVSVTGPIGITGIIGVTGPISVTQGTSLWVTSGTQSISNFPNFFGVTGTIGISGVVGGTVFVSNFPNIQAVTGPITVNQASSPWVVSGSITSIIANSIGVSVSNFPFFFGVTGTLGISGVIGGTVSIANFPLSQGITGVVGGTVSITGGTVSISNFPALQGVTGPIQITQGTSPWVVSGAVTTTVVNFPAFFGVTGTLGISGVIGGTVSIANFPATQAVTQSGLWFIGQSGIWNVGVSGIVGVTGSVGRTWVLSSTTDSVLDIPSDGAKTTYSASAVGFVPPAAATDVFSITGSGTKTIRVTRLEIDGTTTSGSGISLNLQLVKRSTANSGGTSSSVTAASHDSANAAATATVLSYTANPTLGTLVGVVRTARFSFVTVGTDTLGEDWDFGTRPSQAIVLRGTSQVLAVNFGGVTITGPVVDITVEWTEE